MDFGVTVQDVVRFCVQRGYAAQALTEAGPLWWSCYGPAKGTTERAD